MAYLTRRHFSKTIAAATAALSLNSIELPVLAASDLDPREDDRIAGLSLTEAVRQLRAGSVTSTQLTRACLNRIRIYNPKVDAYITVLSEQSLAQAAQMDVEQKANKLRGPLHGIPIALKDNIDTAGIRTTAASKVYDDRVPTEDAEVTRRLQAAGAVLLGKTNLDEFADAVSYFGSVRNPWALDRDPSGSSSGSAAAVATDLAYRRSRYGHRRLCSFAISLLRHCGNQAYVWPGSDSRHYSPGIFAGSLRADYSDG